MDPNIQMAFIGMFFYPLVDIFFSYFERYCHKGKKRFEGGYYSKMLSVVVGWLLLIIVGLIVFARWKGNMNFDDFGYSEVFLALAAANEEDDAKCAHLIILCVPVMVWAAYESEIFDNLIDLARSSPLEFSILFTSGPILIISGAFEMLSPLFFGFDWIYYFVLLGVFLFYSVVGATAVDQNYARDDDERDEFELDEIGTGYYRMEGLDGMIMGITADNYMFSYSTSARCHRCCSDRMIRLDQLPPWILEHLINNITNRIFMEVVGEYKFGPEIDKFFTFVVPPPFLPSEFDFDGDDSIMAGNVGMRTIEEYPKSKKDRKYLPPDDSFNAAVRLALQFANREIEECKKKHPRRRV